MSALMLLERGAPLAPLGAGNEFQAFLQRINAAPMLSVEQESNLARRLREEGDVQAAHTLVFSHMRLVVKTAREYLGYRLPLPDLVQEGSVGLMHAVKRFDPSRGARLASYALWWIRASIHEFILKGWSLVKVATTQMRRKLFFKLRQAKEDSAPLSESEAVELAEKFGADVETILDMDGRLSGADESLNQPAIDGGAEIQDLIADERPNQELAALSHEQQEMLGEMVGAGLDGLDPRERRIVSARLMGEQPVTLETLSVEMGVSRERVRQLESRALKKLRAFFLSAPDKTQLLLEAV